MIEQKKGIIDRYPFFYMLIFLLTIREQIRFCRSLQ